MEKSPQFIKEFSKEESPEERQQAAQAIKAKRAKHFAEKRAQTEGRAEVQQATGERERALAEQLDSVHNLENEITELSTSRLGKVLNYFKLRKLRADVAVGQRTYDELKQQQDTKVAEQQAISEKLDSEETPPALQEAKTMLANFYKEQKEKWARSEYTKEDIIENFSEEHLASLSLEDYALLLKRFPEEMVAHVTRQGIRDHIGHMYHTAGEGVYADGFMKMVEDGRLRSPLGVYLVEDEKEQAIARFLHLDNFKTKEEALNYLATLIEGRQGDAGSYVDRIAIHFATEEVADCYYGSEQGNEIFVAYPSAHIASQYYFSGQLNEGGGGYWNDQWVWANEERGMDLNAGLIFIPEEARVDRKTGSRYELDETGNPIKNSEYQDAFRRVADSPDFHHFAEQVMEITGKLNQNWDSPNLLSKNRKLLEKLEPFRQRLEQKFSITDRRLQMAILDYHHLRSIDIQKKNQEEGREGLVDSVIESAMKNRGILYTEAKNTISSKEFWEARFAKNPAKRPSKVVYYKGSSPTRALHEWRDAQDIHKRTKDKNIGFPERHIQRDAPQATAGVDRFKILADKVIEDHFAQRKSVV
jgi:hypothetical protein